MCDDACRSVTGRVMPRHNDHARDTCRGTQNPTELHAGDRRRTASAGCEETSGEENFLCPEEEGKEGAESRCFRNQQQGKGEFGSGQRDPIHAQCVHRGRHSQHAGCCGATRCFVPYSASLRRIMRAMPARELESTCLDTPRERRMRHRASGRAGCAIRALPPEVGRQGACQKGERQQKSCQPAISGLKRTQREHGHSSCYERFPATQYTRSTPARAGSYRIVDGRARCRTALASRV